MIRKEIIGNCTLYCGDCHEILKDIEDNSIDLIHTDPPYKIHSGVQNSKMYIEKGINQQQEKLVKANISNSFDYNIFDEFRRVCKNINYQIWCSKKQYIDYLKMADKNKWNWQDICLYRNNALPNVNGKYQDKDYLVHIWKGRKLTGSYHQKITDYHWNIGGEKKYKHPALKPLEPIMNLIQVGSDVADTILDPFMGSGTVGVACIKTGRRFIGIEIDENYFNMAVERIRKEYEIIQ